MKAWVIKSVLTLAALQFASGIDAELITPGADFNVDSSLDTDGDNRWEDTTGATAADLQLDSSPAVTRLTDVSSLKGIQAAYDFPGGSTGNEAGALLNLASSGVARSFQEEQGDWSNEDVTIEIWFKPDNLTPTPTNGQILFEDGGGTGFGFFVDNNELRLRKAPGSGNVSSNIAGISSEFIQAVGTYDVSAGEMELFVNGASVGTATPGGGDWSGGDGAAVGTRGEANTGGIGNGQSSTESFDGQVAIMRVYRNQILTDSQVLDNFNAVSDSTPHFVFGGVLEYDAGQDDGSNSTWENTGAQSGFDITVLSGETFVENPTTNKFKVPATYDFDGIGSGGNLASLAGINEGIDVSFELLFRPSDLTGDEVIFETGGGNGVGFFLGGGTNSVFSGVSDSELTFSVTQNSLGTQTAFVTTDLSGIGVGEFIHVIGTFDITGDVVALYVNGELVGAATATANITAWSGGDNAGLGRIGGSNMGGVAGGSQGFTNYDGEIAIFRVLGRALDQNEVSARYTALLLIPEPSTFALASLIPWSLGFLGWRRRRR